jgi:hypothetical protein
MAWLYRPPFVVSQRRSSRLLPHAPAPEHHQQPALAGGGGQLGLFFDAIDEVQVHDTDFNRHAASWQTLCSMIIMFGVHQ